MPCAETVGDRRWQSAVGDRVDEGDRQTPDDPPAGVARPVRGALDRVQRLARLDHEYPPGVSQTDAASAALEQGHPELVLELSHLPAERRLRQMQAAGGAGEVLLLGDGHERAELAEVHGSIPYGYR